MKFGGRGFKVGVGAAAVLLWVGAGCDRDAEPEAVVDPVAPAQPEEEAVEVEPTEPDAEEAEPPGPPSGPLSFASWPGREELHTFDLMWLGGEREVALYEAPDATSASVGRASWMDTEEIVWEDSRVRVTEPTFYEVSQALEVVGLAYDESFEELDAEELHLELEEGELLALYQYGGEGTCFVGARGQVLLGACPDEAAGLREVEAPSEAPSQREGAAAGEGAHAEVKERWRPRQQEWWVKVRHDAESGWMRVDDAPIEVHVRLIEGYD
ncbi:hypothetical protein FRC98_00325 [Lujinxingia vulgaris]|uniref:Lipoprotein n=1 Tax=Lujinxingia vulgaris TaxID=2600176 RepID=A0A5C6XG93_9DELT|nr:hypothetical protein [Lujinxingia vulgaris]TXD38884.1 hypothetical protein FRC98_00325 [Lujinxingia vulgaris]